MTDTEAAAMQYHDDAWDADYQQLHQAWRHRWQQWVTTDVSDNALAAVNDQIYKLVGGLATAMLGTAGPGDGAQELAAHPDTQRRVKLQSCVQELYGRAERAAMRTLLQRCVAAGAATGTRLPTCPAVTARGLPGAEALVAAHPILFDDGVHQYVWYRLARVAGDSTAAGHACLMWVAHRTALAKAWHAMHANGDAWVEMPNGTTADVSTDTGLRLVEEAVIQAAALRLTLWLKLLPVVAGWQERTFSAYTADVEQWLQGAPPNDDKTGPTPLP